MKLILALLIATGLQVSASPSYAQKVTLSGNNISLKTMFNEIRAQTGLQFFYKTNYLKNAKTVNIEVKDVPVKRALNRVFKDQPLTYTIIGNTIVVKKKKRKKMKLRLLGNMHDQHNKRNFWEEMTGKIYGNGKQKPPQEIQITGLVTDSSGSPLPGVTIFVKNDKSIGTTTDLHGRYVLEVPDNAVVIFSMIGFEQQEVPITKDEQTIDITLLPASNKLGETVVVAFGKQKKEDVVGAVTTINPEELKVPSSNLTTALAGKLSGVIAYQRSGEPGADNADFFIRGVTTFGYKKNPLILVDGIELSVNDLSRMQVDDIASFSILKDATATALYGARGANGVILITTKEGHEGKAHVSIRVENSMSRATRNVRLANAETYMRLNNEAVVARDPLAPLPYSEKYIDNVVSKTNPYVYPNVNWQKMLLKNHTMNQRVNLNVSGGGHVARYYLAGTFYQDNGILKVDKRNNFNNNIDQKTYELRSNVNINITHTTEIGVKLYGTFVDYRGPVQGGTQVYHDIMRSDPVRFPAYFPKDSSHIFLHHILFGNSENNDYLNPYSNLVKGYKNKSNSLMLAQFNLKQDLSFLTKGLSLSALFNTTRKAAYSVSRAYNPFYYNVGFYNMTLNTYSLTPLNEESGTEYLDYNEDPKTVTSSTYIQARLNYERTFADKHGISGLLVFLLENNVDGNAGSVQTSLPHRNIGLSGRFTYSYNQKYFAEFDFGYNGSERFDKSHRFGFFPSVGVSWIISKEKFWEAISPVITSLKLRGTYGLIGNDAIGSPSDRFFYISDVNMDDAGKGATFGLDNTEHKDGITVNRYSNPRITWEESHKTNLGFDMTLLNHFDLTADFWKEKRTQILQTRSFIPTTMGLNPSATPQANVGQAEGKGVDLALDYSQVFVKNWWAKARVNFTYAVSRFLVYEEPSYSDIPWRSRIGYPIGQQWGYIAEHLFVDEKEVANSPKQSFGDYQAGDIKYRDINGDGVITTKDQVPIGYPTSPEIVYGFGLSLGYKNLDFSVFFQGLANESFWIDYNAVAPFNKYTYSDDPSWETGKNLRNQLLQVIADNHWSESNQDLYAFWPRLSAISSIGNENNSQRSTWFMRNGAFLRLKSAEVGYTFSDNLIKRIHLNNVRFYVNGTNLLSFSSFKLWDPEMAGNGLGYPVQRVVNVGIQVSF